MNETEIRLSNMLWRSGLIYGKFLELLLIVLAIVTLLSFTVMILDSSYNHDYLSAGRFRLKLHGNDRCVWQSDCLWSRLRFTTRVQMNFERCFTVLDKCMTLPTSSTSVHLYIVAKSYQLKLILKCSSPVRADEE